MQWRRREVNIIKTCLGGKINRLGDGLIRCVRSQDYSQVSGVGNWAVINEREYMGKKSLWDCGGMMDCWISD